MSKQTRNELAAVYILAVGCLMTFATVHAHHMLSQITTAMDSASNNTPQTRIATQPAPEPVILARN